MNSISQFAKENFQLILLLLSVLGVVIAFLSLVKEIQAKKRRNKKQEEAENETSAGQGNES